MGRSGLGKLLVWSGAMSEYQYLEFQAIDRPLTKNQMTELRSYSTRARITRASFVNEYSWGKTRSKAMVGLHR